METKTKSATANKAYEKPLDPPMFYEWSWLAYKTEEEFLADPKAPLSVKQQMKVRNDAAAAKARSAAYTEALEARGIEKPTSENDPNVAIKEMIKPMLAQKNKDGSPKFTEEQAKIAACNLLGIDPDDLD
jgi:hypothetical protein